MADSKQIDDGGLAFPGTRAEQVGTMSDHGVLDDDTPTYGEVQHSGMSLRDWFAGQALTSFGTWMPQGFSNLNGDDALAARASLAYRQADAMIAARKAGA